VWVAALLAKNRRIVVAVVVGSVGMIDSECFALVVAEIDFGFDFVDFYPAAGSVVGLDSAEVAVADFDSDFVAMKN